LTVAPFANDTSCNVIQLFLSQLGVHLLSGAEMNCCKNAHGRGKYAKPVFLFPNVLLVSGNADVSITAIATLAETGNGVCRLSIGPHKLPILFFPRLLPPPPSFARLSQRNESSPFRMTFIYLIQF
jgi:hypothetical protein